MDQRALLDAGMTRLHEDDPELGRLLDGEVHAQAGTLAMVAYASLADPSVLACGGAALSNVTAEGYPGHRYHPGCAQLDGVESLAQERAREAFGAQYANVQPHSCSSANLSVLFSLLRAGDPILGLHLDAGGHLTHGSPASVVGRYFEAHTYGVDRSGRLDYDEIRTEARRHRPKLIFAGASAYPRTFDYAAFREIADEVGAWLVADISHVAGLVAGGVIPSPVDHAHVTTSSTYKQLGGPRGGVILVGKDAGLGVGATGRTLAQTFQSGVFPRSQGTLNPGAVAAKARTFELVRRPEFAALAGLIQRDARALAAAMVERGHRVLTGGTDTHMVLTDVSASGLSGAVAERALEACGVLANRNRVPGDPRKPTICSGLRLGTNILAQRGLEEADMETCADLVDEVLGSVVACTDEEFVLDDVRADRVRARVADLCERFPVPGYEPVHA